MQRSFTALAVMLSLGAVVARAQAPAESRISGVVLQAGAALGAQAPVPGAIVQLVGTADSTITDDDGHFSMRLVPPGQYTVVVKRIGFLPYQHALVVAAHPVLLTVHLVPQRADTLTRTPVQLQAITVTAAPPERENPATTITVPSIVISQTPAVNTYDLLRQTAGLEVHLQGQGPGFAPDASIRGFSSDHSTDMALWVDGVPINEPVNGHAEGYNDWFLVFPQAIEAVDVVKGPTSPVYGNFALSGAVNMRTIEHLHGFQLSGSGGAFERYEGVGLGGWENQHNHGVLGIRGESQQGWRPNSDYKVGQVHARMVQDLSTSASLDGGIELYGTNWHSPGFLSDSLFSLGEYDVTANPTDGGFKRRAQERLSLRVLDGSSAAWRTTLYGTQGRWQLFLTTPPEGGLSEGTGSQTEEEDRRHGWGGTSAVTIQLPRMEITVGTEGRWDRSDYQNWLTTDRARDSAQILVSARQLYGAVFLATTENIGNRLSLNIGGRLDGRNTEATPAGGPSASAGTSIVSPKLGALYHLPAGGDLYANVSRGFKQADGVITDPTLPFITAWAYEAGFKLETRHAAGSIAAFRMDVSNEQTFNPVTLETTSGGASRRQGVELGLRAHQEFFQVDGDWTFNDAKYRDFVTEDGDTLSGTRVFNTSRFIGSFALQLSPPEARWYVRLSSNVVGPYTPFDEPGVELPTYALFHVGAGIRIATAQLQLGVRNLFDKAYPELRAGGSVSPGQPRTIFATVRYDF